MTWKSAIYLPLFYFFSLQCSFSQDSQIYEYQEDSRTKSFWDGDTVQSKGKKDFLNVDGQGVITRLWWTAWPKENAEENLRFAQQMILNVYWDGSDKAAISVPIADFFCQPLNLQLFDNYFFNSTNDKLVFNAMIPMPFRQNARFEVVNYSNEEVVFWFGADLEMKELEDNNLYLHAYRQILEDVPQDSAFFILPEVSGKGKFLGVHLGLNQQNVLENWPWYTRPVSISLDKKGEAEKPDMFINTIDDYFASGWWDREQKHETYDFDFTGRPYLSVDENNNLRISMYRYHVRDPFWFSENLSFKIGENWNFGDQEIGNGDWSTTVFFYLDDPQNNLEGNYSAASIER